MKVEVKKVNTLERELSFDVPQDRVNQKMNDVYKSISRHAKIKGFRPGKAPRSVLEKTHGQIAREEMLKSLIPEIYTEGIKSEGLDPIDLPQIKDVDFTDSGVTFKATIDLRPEVKIKSYKGLKVKSASKEVTDDELAKTLEVFTKAPGKKGEDGKEQKVEINDEFAQNMGFKTLDEFKDTLKKQMEMDKARQARMQEDDDLVEQLLKNVKLDIPQSLVNRQVYSRMEQMAKTMSQQGMKEEEIKSKMEESKKEIEQAAQKDVKVFLTLQEIAKVEKMEIKEGEPLAYKVIEFLRNEAKWEEKKK